MQKYEYRTVPAPKVLSIINETQEAAAIASFGNLINQGAQQGWEFVSMESITTEEAPGCLAFLGGSRGRVKVHNMLVFKRKIES